MAVDIQSLASQIVSAVQKAPELAQQFVSDPAGMVEKVTGAASADYDLTDLFGATMAKLAEASVDLSHVDLSKLDMSSIDISRLNLAELAKSAGQLGIDLTKLDLSKLGGLAGLAGGLLGKGGLFGGLFG